MREAYRDWLGSQSYGANTQNTQSSHAKRLEAHYGDLDELYDRDRFASLRASLEYSKRDEAAGRPNPSKIEIDGNVYNGLASYRASLSYYTRFREHEAAVAAGQGLKFEPDALEAARRQFLAIFPDFDRLRFQASEGAYWNVERGYKDEVIERAQALLAEPGLDEATLGQRMVALMQQPPANFVGWRTFSLIHDAGPDPERAVASALGEMLRSEDEAAAAAGACAAAIHTAIARTTQGSYFGEVRSLVTSALALARPGDAIAVKTRYMQRAARQLTGRGLFPTAAMTTAEYAQVLAFAEALFTVMRDQWDWRPRDLWDVQGFLWALSDPDMAEAEATPAPAATAPVEPAGPKEPLRATNLILYGPPGTGKTYATAERAVRICDGGVPGGGRPALMARYKELVARKRIAFVTFHQSYSYEDFVEGLRPETGSSGEGAESSGGGGFTLRPQGGLFRRIADLARNNHGQASAAPKPDRTRRVFKMSLGRNALEEGARLFRESMDGGYVVLGYGGEIDWAAPQYDDGATIAARWRQDHPDATNHDATIQQLSTFRAEMRIGDLVVVTAGNKRFRAIGEITGPYRYIPGYLREYNHRRPVRWLWRDDEGQPGELIYRKNFSQVSCYELDGTQVDWPALDQLVAGGGQVAAAARSLPDPYVLIIDEINRANVSKVFGELITLIEPDKRLGAANELTVTLPYSGDTFGVPANLHIVGAMNTADRSIALLDTALRRRFQFEELMPDPGRLEDVKCDVDLSALLRGLNDRIEYLFDRDHQIGHAFFMSCDSVESVGEVMRTKVIPLLAEYFYDDWEKVRQALGETTDQGSFVGRTRLKPPGSADVSDEGRWRYSVHRTYPLSAYDQLKA